MGQTRVYYLLDTKCNHNCRECYLGTQKNLPARLPKIAIKDVSILKNQGFDVRVTGSNLVKYPLIGTLVSCCEQDYLLSDAWSISKDVDKMRMLRRHGIRKIFLTSPLSFHLLRPNTIDIDKAVESIKLARLEPILSYILGEPNRKYLKRMIHEALRLKVKSIRFMRFMPTLGGEQHSFMTDDELSSLLEEIYQFRENIPKNQLNIHIHGHFGTWFRKQKGPVCFAGENLFIIGLDNKIYPCEFLMYPRYALGYWDGNNVHIERRLKGLSNYDCKLKQMFVDKKNFLLEKCRNGGFIL